MTSTPENTTITELWTFLSLPHHRASLSHIKVWDSLLLRENKCLDYEHFVHFTHLF